MHLNVNILGETGAIASVGIINIIPCSEWIPHKEGMHSEQLVNLTKQVDILGIRSKWICSLLFVQP